MISRLKNMAFRKKLTFSIFLFIGIAALFCFIFLPYIKYMTYNKNSLVLVFRPVNQNISTVCAEPTNKFYIKIEVRTNSGKPVDKASINLSIKSGSGHFNTDNIRTDKNGEALVSYIPSTLTGDEINSKNTNVQLNAAIHNSNISSSFNITLQPPPVILVHGYQADGTAFNNINDYLSSKGFQSFAITYSSQDGVSASSEALESFLKKQTTDLLSKGIQVRKFDIISHSMGGLVARYYTCSPKYAAYDNVRKLIFLAVPHKGSVWAPIGQKYYDNQAIKDLTPGNDLLTKIFPSLINKGLNNTIQTGNIRSEYDEVVSPESSDLEEWNIKTEVFNLGDNSFTMDNLLTGNIMESPNHKSVLNNKKVFERLEEMLLSELRYPSGR